MDYCFQCPVCKASMYLDDWCGIRDHAARHMTQCHPEQIDIFHVTPEGEIMSQHTFRQPRAPSHAGY